VLRARVRLAEAGAKRDPKGLLERVAEKRIDTRVKAGGKKSHAAGVWGHERDPTSKIGLIRPRGFGGRMTYKGFIIEERSQFGQWYFRVSKPASLPIITGGDVTFAWISAPYMDRDFGFQQVKNLIDAGGLK
jgi:hypothetical protein